MLQTKYQKAIESDSDGESLVWKEKAKQVAFAIEFYNEKEWVIERLGRHGQLSQQLSAPGKEEAHGWVDGQSEEREWMMTLKGTPLQSNIKRLALLLRVGEPLEGFE